MTDKSKRVWTVPITIYATAYVRAKTRTEVRRLCEKQLRECSLEVYDDDEMISSKQLDDPDLPQLSISPAMTIAEYDGDGMEEA